MKFASQPAQWTTELMGETLETWYDMQRIAQSVVDQENKAERHKRAIPF